jgi:WD40 repeat protein
MSFFQRKKSRKDSLISIQVKRGNSILITKDFSIIGTNDGFLLQFDFKSLSMTNEVHTSLHSVECLLRSFDSSFWASGYPEIQLWSFDFELLSSFAGHTSAVVGLGLLGKDLISASEDCSVKRWNIETQKFSDLYSHNHPIISFAFEPCNTLVASSCSGKLLVLYSAELEEEKCKTVVKDNIWCMQFIKSKLLVTGDHNCLIIVRDLVELKEIRKIRVHDSRVKCMAVNFDGSLMATGGFDQRVCVLDTKDFFLRKSFEGQSDWVRAVGFDMSDNVLSVSDDKYIEIWNLNKGKEKVGCRVIVIGLIAVVLIAIITALCGYVLSF